MTSAHGEPIDTARIGLTWILALALALPALSQAPVVDTAAADTPAAEPAPAPADDATPASGEVAAPVALDPSSVETFVDGFMAAYLEESGVVGGVVSIVQDGRVVLAKGYGHADRESDVEVDAARTLFRVGSVSKLFVWTSVMQLVERGELDLDADVNDYLDGLAVPDTYSQPVTLTHLMTHTPGFEDHVLGLFAHDADAVLPLRELLAAEMPARVRPPGEYSSYSNHGTGIAMLAVEQVSGTPWLEYLETRILEPLGMERTTFRQPVPEALAGDLAKGYRQAGGKPQEEGFEYIPLAPVGAASTTALDMARFMIAHLDYGRLGDARILAPETARRMRRQLHRHAEGLAGMAHGFIEGDRGGRRVIGHGGDTLWFHTHLELYPEEKIGLFASFNTAGGEPQKLAAAFAERFFPGIEPSPPPLTPDAADRLRRCVGSYRSMRYSHHDFTKIGALFSQLEVVDGGDGSLRRGSSGDERWVEVAPFLFRGERDGARIAFRQGRRGAITHAFLGAAPMLAFERVPRRESLPFVGGLLAGALALFLATLAIGPAGMLLRWRYQVTPPKRQARLPFVARALLWLGSLVFVTFFAALAIHGDPMKVVFGLEPGLRRILMLAPVGAAIAIACLLCAIWIWRARRGGAPARVAYTLVAAALLVVVWQLLVWRFLVVPW